MVFKWVFKWVFRWVFKWVSYGFPMVSSHLKSLISLKSDSGTGPLVSFARTPALFFVLTSMEKPTQISRGPSLGGVNSAWMIFVEDIDMRRS